MASVTMLSKHGNETQSKEQSIVVLVHNASRHIPAVWPLDTFIACNPLQGFESRAFDQAVAEFAASQINPKGHLALEAVNWHMIKWCASYFDNGQSTINMPYREKGFYFVFLKLAGFDKKLHRHQKEAMAFLGQLPVFAEEAIQQCLKKLQVFEGQEAFLAQTLSYLPGWAGFVKWKTNWQTLKKGEEKRDFLIDFVAVRLVLTCLLWPDASKDNPPLADVSWTEKALSRLKRNEAMYRDTLLPLLAREVKNVGRDVPQSHAQLVFCIDVRSEPFRRAIESLGHYETFGFAGFFGLPVRVHEWDSDQSKDCCPVLLKPRHDVKEVPAAVHKAIFARYRRGKFLSNGSKNLYRQLKHNVSTPFALVESLGFWCGMTMILKSLAPAVTKGFLLVINKWLKPMIPTRITYEFSEIDKEQGLSLQEQLVYAETVLRLMGLTSGFAKVIILCGHGSTTENNPYAAALDCGACAGNHGGFNARLLAAILNKSEVRRGLMDCGLPIPADTVFYGALHNTTTDAVTLYAHDAEHAMHPHLLRQLQKDLEEAQRITNQVRAMKLGDDRSQKNIIRRSMDWSETRPEWGLARNAAFIVAPRSLTKNIPLEGRCFLHSYRFEQDHEGGLLEAILTAPMVVAQWINAQYLFSTLDNVAFGSGSKVTHNVVGMIGVMQGNGSDLMHGLPLQSVMRTDNEAYHEPQRLLTVVYAPKERVDKVIDKHSILKQLFFNQWVHLVVIDPADQRFYQLNSEGQWGVLEAVDESHYNPFDAIQGSMAANPVLAMLE